eukprot:11590092-Alexandrium_andersonii.AAC.1
MPLLRHPDGCLCPAPVAAGPSHTHSRGKHVHHAPPALASHAPGAGHRPSAAACLGGGRCP